MDYTNAETLGDNSMTEIESCNFAVDNGGLYDPSDDLAELHWLASFLDEPLLEKAPKPLFSPSFGAKTKDIHGEEQSSDKLKSSISISILERSSCSGNISTFSPEMAAPEKERNGMAGFSDRSSPHANSNMVLENCPKPFPAANAAVSSDSDHLISEQAKSHPSNKVSKANQGTETKWEDVTKVMKCINCDTRKTAQWIAGPMGPKVLCIACGERYRTGRHLHHFVSELEKSHASNKISKTNEGIKRKGQGTVQVKKCMHCGIQRTPQWRAGPMGPKTLCNACGVRYRSGRLLPEYRPAASPTFSVDKHSNFHKALLERKGQKETAAKQASEAKQMYSGSEEQALYVEASQKVLKNCPNSSLFANASVCSDSDYFISKQPKSDPLKKFPKSNQGIIRKGQDAMKVSKCMQCSKHKTPQWRDGPMSPKTLCNDCGVSYRPGKLMPDYRLDASPTFSDDEHSNSHRKVLERRDQKEFATQASQEKQTYFSSEVQASCVETPQDGLESCPNSFLSVNASFCNGLDYFVSEQASPGPLKKIQKKNQGIIRKGQNTMKVRKCMHCSIKKTPQWRDGPMGPKTLCNACGVRYRSGRLLPEYRPAASPTFSVDKHSNSHKKVLEMRVQKEFGAQQPT